MATWICQENEFQAKISQIDFISSDFDELAKNALQIDQKYPRLIKKAQKLLKLAKIVRKRFQIARST